MTILSVVRSRMLAPAAAALLPAYVSACFRYVPSARDQLPGPRTEVQVRLAEPMRIPLGEVTLEDVTKIEGIVAESNGDSLGLWAKWLYPRVGRKYDALGATFYLARKNIAGVDEYRLSPQRTLLGAVIAGAIVAGFLYATGLAKVGGSGGQPPGDSFMLWGAGLPH